MNHKKLTFSETNSFIMQLEGVLAWKLAHVADGLIFLYLGKTINLIDKEVAEFVLHIQGQWELKQSGSITITNTPLATDSRATFFQRMEETCERFDSKKIIKVKVAENEKRLQLFFNDQTELFVSPGPDGFFSLRRNLWENNWHLSYEPHNPSPFLLFTQQ